MFITFAPLNAFAALTDQDEENILLSLFVKNTMSGKIITKVSKTEFDEIVKPLGLDTIITPKSITSDVIIRYVRSMKGSMESNVETLYKIMDDKVEVLEFKVKSDFPQLQIPFKELETKKNTLIAGIVRDRKIIIPSGDDYLMSGDKVVVVAANQRISKLSDILS